MKCRWYPLKPFRWDYTDQHQTALQAALHQDDDVKPIGEDVMNIIKQYIIEMVVEEKKKDISYKRVRSNIYDESDSIHTNSKICNEYLMHYGQNLKQTRKMDEISLRIVVMGKEGVGKTSLCNRIVADNPDEDYKPEIKDSFRKIVTFGKDTGGVNQAVIYDILDTAGQMEFIALLDHWIRDEGEQFWLCFDVMRADTFDYIIETVCNRIITLRNEKETSIIFVGCKNDLRFKDMVQSYHSYYYQGMNEIESVDVMRRIEEIGDFPYIETSSKDKINTVYLEKFAMYEHWVQTQTNVIDWQGLYEKYANDDGHGKHCGF